MVVAGIVWTVAGVNILRIGIDCWAQVSGGFVLMLLGAVAVFAAFQRERIVCTRRYGLLRIAPHLHVEVEDMARVAAVAAAATC